MAIHFSDVIDFQAYRERKAEESRASQPTETFGHGFHYGQVPVAPFALPMAFFVFWPTMVFTPNLFVLAAQHGGGAA